MDLEMTINRSLFFICKGIKVFTSYNAQKVLILKKEMDGIKQRKMKRDEEITLLKIYEYPCITEIHSSTVIS